MFLPKDSTPTMTTKLLGRSTTYKNQELCRYLEHKHGSHVSGNVLVGSFEHF